MTNAEHTLDMPYAELGLPHSDCDSAFRADTDRIMRALRRWSCTVERRGHVLRKDPAAAGDAIDAIDELAAWLDMLRARLVISNRADQDAHMAYSAALLATCTCGNPKETGNPKCPACTEEIDGIFQPVDYFRTGK